MRKKKGITLITLVVAIIVMSILATVAVITGGNSYDRAIKMGLEVEINQIELLMNNYLIRNSEKSLEQVELNISTYSEQEKAQFKNEIIIDNVVTLYVVDLYEIDAHEVNYGAGKNGTRDRYLYSKETKNVYYDLGLEVDGVVYHRINSVEVGQ